MERLRRFALISLLALATIYGVAAAVTLADNKAASGVPSDTQKSQICPLKPDPKTASRLDRECSKCCCMSAKLRLCALPCKQMRVEQLGKNQYALRTVGNMCVRLCLLKKEKHSGGEILFEGEPGSTPSEQHKH